MTSLLFDTSAVIGLFERESSELRSLIARSSTPVSISTLTLGELETGYQRASTPARENTLAMAYTAMEHVQVDGKAGPACCGFIDASTSRRIGSIDAWITASALLNGFDLVTQDAKLEQGLASIDWSASRWAAPTIRLVPISPNITST